MITRTKHIVDLDLIEEATQAFKTNDFKTTLNEPTGSFFYDGWKIKDKYKNTVWEKLLNTLAIGNYGEARVIKLDIERCYTAHADIDDRWHLSLDRGKHFLVDLDTLELHSTKLGYWYNMDTSILHSAVNFGDNPRYQLVVRQLLNDAKIVDSSKVQIIVKGEHSRYKFDSTLSPWLNRANKDSRLNSFTVNDNIVKFNIPTDDIEILQQVVPEEFEFTYVRN